MRTVWGQLGPHWGVVLQDIVRTVWGAAGAALGDGVIRYCEGCVGQLGPHWGVVL